MTWHKVTLHPKTSINHRIIVWNYIGPLRQWCDHNLSSHGILWKNDPYNNWFDFYFAQPQDAVMFRLVHSI